MLRNPKAHTAETEEEILDGRATKVKRMYEIDTRLNPKYLIIMEV